MAAPPTSERIPLKPEGAITLSAQNLEILSRAERGELDCPRCQSRLHGEPVDLGEEVTIILLCLQCGFREV